MFFNDTATTEIYTLSLHDALPIYWDLEWAKQAGNPAIYDYGRMRETWLIHLCTVWMGEDRQSTRLNSSHANISYAVFCLNKLPRLGRVGHERARVEAHQVPHAGEV